MRALPLALLLLATAALAPARAQTGSGHSAYISGRVVVHQTDEPLEGADITLVGRDGRWITDEDGRFVMPEVEPGAVLLRVEFLGYATAEGEIELEEAMGYQVEVRMDAQAIEIEGFVVTARPRYVSRRLDDVFRRMDRAATGYFLTHEELVARGHPPLAEALRMVPGARVVHSRGLSWSVSFRGGCRPEIYMDGVRALGGSDLWALTTLDIEVLEVYPGPAGIPAEYRDLGTRCAVLVWSRIRAPTP